MPGSPTLFELFLRLPFDPLLRDVLTDLGLALPPVGVSLLPSALAAARLTEAVDAAPAATREHVLAQFHRIGLLADVTGARYVRNAAHGRPEVLSPLSMLSSDTQRALWLYHHHPDLFEEAEAVCWADRHPCTCVQQRAIAIRQPVDRSDQARIRFAEAIEAFLLGMGRGGQQCHCVLNDRHIEGSVQATVYLWNRVDPQTQSANDQRLTRDPAVPALRMAIVYSPSQGVIRTLVDEGPAYHEALVMLFARHLLHCEVDPRAFRPAGIDMNRLRHPLPLLEDGLLESVHLREVALLDEMTGGEITIRTNGCSRTEQDVHAMLGEWLPSSSPFQMPRFRLAAAWLEIAIFDAPKANGRRTMTLALQHQGGNNLEDFDRQTRRQLETWMVGWKLIPEHHALEARTASAGSNTPVLV